MTRSGINPAQGLNQCRKESAGMKRKNRRPNWILCLAGVLFCLTLFSMHLTSGLYARYVARGTSGDRAMVAKFSIEQTGTIDRFIAVDVCPDFTSQTYTIALENNSEVDVAYTVHVERMTENLPLNLTLTGSNVSEGSGGITAAGTMDANSGVTVSYGLRIAWPGSETAEAYSQEIDAIRVTVRAEQID